jgi:predicted N-acetyltransferase YhbS
MGNIPTIIYRSEEHGDEEAIDLVNFRAFMAHHTEDGVPRVDEHDLVRYLRAYYPGFDRRYSITAWDKERCVGHALFTPARIRLLGETVDALAVGPVAVDPDHQRQGIGGQLLRSGHELGRQEGFGVAFLCGHPTYYPRHGYVACHGFAKVTLDLDALPPSSGRLHALPVTSADVPWLVACGEAEWADVDFAWIWGDALTEWTAPGAIALMWWTEDGRRAAYTLADPRGRWRHVLGEDPDFVREALCTVRPATLDHHPSGWLARNVLDPAWSTATVERGDPAMACALQEGALDPLLNALESGTRPPGCVNWALPFILIP